MHTRPKRRWAPAAARRRTGFTLVEVMVAMTVTLILMGMVVTIFSSVNEGVQRGRAVMEMADRVRQVRNVLQTDLEGVTAPMLPPLDPGAGLGHFEYVEGPMIAQFMPADHQRDNPFRGDTTIGDLDDILMFTTRLNDDWFYGRFGRLTNSTSNTNAAVFMKRRTVRTVQAQTAEVCWFVRGTNLYRRVLLVRPETRFNLTSTTVVRPTTPLNEWDYYFDYDLSIRQEGGLTARRQYRPLLDMEGHVGLEAVCNSLGDLTKRENRYAHQPLTWPHEVRFWNTTQTGGPGFGLPTLAECSIGRVVYSNNSRLDKMWPFPMFERVRNSEIVPQSTTALIPSRRFPHDPYNLIVVPQGIGATDSANDVTTGLNDNHARLINRDFLRLTCRNPIDLWGLMERRGTSAAGAANRFPVGQQRFSAESTFQNGLMNNWYGNTSPIRRGEEDLVLTNVLSFDVKVWDPGAPLFHIEGTPRENPDDPVNSAVIIPGDFAYNPRHNAGAMYRWLQTGHTHVNGWPCGFGAYVDLNYFCRGIFVSSRNPVWQHQERLLLLENALQVPPGTFPRPHFAGPGDGRSGLAGTFFMNSATSPGNWGWLASTYCTYSTHYERDGIDQNGVMGIDESSNGIDDNGNGRIDERGLPFFDANHDAVFNPADGDAIDTTIDPAFPHGTGALRYFMSSQYTQPTAVAAIDVRGEQETAPPYRHPIRGIQVKIRCFEPSSREIREVTIIQEYLPE